MFYEQTFVIFLVYRKFDNHFWILNKYLFSWKFEFFSFGTTHFCAVCHDDFQRLMRLPKNLLPKCPAGPKGLQLEGSCPLRILHPPTGEEFALGCGICRNLSTFWYILVQFFLIFDETRYSLQVHFRVYKALDRIPAVFSVNRN